MAVDRLGKGSLFAVSELKQGRASPCFASAGTVHVRKHKSYHCSVGVLEWLQKHRAY